MIRINLIPVKRKKKAKPVATYLVIAVFVTMGTVGGAIFYNSFLGTKIKELEGRVKSNTDRIAELDRKIKEVQDFKARNDKFTERKQVIESLTAGQSLPARLLDEISLRIIEGIWLTSINISGNQVKLSGVGFTNSDIVDYVQKMKDSKMFAGVVLHGTTKSLDGKTEIFTFQISFTIVG